MSEEEKEWYIAPVDSDSSLQQGDILYDVPSFRAIFSENDRIEFDKRDTISIVIRKFTRCIIISQSCDIGGQKSSKDLSVLVSPLYSKEEYDELKPGLLQDHVLELIRIGKMPSNYMLNSCKIENFEIGISIVDFRQAFSLPLDLLQKLVKDGMKRMRLKSPYSEHLAAAYGRSIMRVGLPSDIPKFPILPKAIASFSNHFAAMSSDERASALKQLQALHELSDTEN